MKINDKSKLRFIIGIILLIILGLLIRKIDDRALNSCIESGNSYSFCESELLR